MEREDRAGYLDEAQTHITWLIERIDTLANATRYDVKDAMGHIQEFIGLARIIRRMEDNHAGEYQPNKLKRRTL